MSCRPVVLLVGGTDPGGGAGLAADLKAVSAMGAHGSMAVTAITVQSTGRVSSWHPVSSSIIAAQMEAILDDGSVNAVKTGMLAEPEIVQTIASFIREKLSDVPYVLDPLLSAGTGDSLGTDDLSIAVISHLLPLSTLCTPNLDEASAITGFDIADRSGMEKAGRIILEMGAESVLVKGGHLSGDPADVLITGSGITWFCSERITEENVHGTGCTLASSIAALLGSGYTVEQAVPFALAYLRQGIRGSFKRGTGTLIGHFPPIGDSPGRGDDQAFYLPPRFCSRCGFELSRTGQYNYHMKCGSCGFIHYRNPLPAVTLLVHEEGRILLVRRARPPAEGALCLPGGFLDLGETVQECGKRELFEETGLSAKECRLFSVETDMTPYGGVMLAVLKIISWSGKETAGDDASETVWVNLDQVPDLAFASHNRLIIKLKETLANNTGR